MRLYCKLAMIVAVGFGLQVLIQRYEGELDEARFAMRTLSLYLRTGRSDHPELMDAALALQDRHMERYLRSAAAEPGPKPSYAAAG